MSLHSAEYFVSRDVETDPDLAIFSKREKEEFAKLQNRVAEFDLFSFPGTYYACSPHTRLGLDILAFAQKLMGRDTFLIREAKRNANSTAAIENLKENRRKRTLICILFMLEFQVNNVFVCSPLLVSSKRTQNFQRCILEKIREVMEYEDIGEKALAAILNLQWQYEENMWALENMKNGNPVVPYSVEWISACGFGDQE